MLPAHDAPSGPPLVPVRRDLLRHTQAAAAGLISQAVPPPIMDAAVAAVTAELLLASPQGLAETKRLLGRDMRRPARREGPRRSPTCSAALFASPEAKEGMAAFLERRKPSWQT